MRYQVPQFVDIEDKIIGPLTLRQFGIYLGGALLLVPVYLFSDLTLFLIIAIPVAGLAVLFAHVKFGRKSLFEVAASALQFAQHGSLFIWQRTPGSRLLPLRGAEYQASSQVNLGLAARARSIETTGNVVREDAEDPFADEENRKEK